MKVNYIKGFYDPFGNILSLNGSLSGANHYRFSSKEWNDDSGLYYYLYRFYDPNLQRWPNRDPFGEKGFDVLQIGFAGKRASAFQQPVERLGGADAYDFVINDPIDDFDLLGLSPGTARPSGPPPAPPTHSRRANPGAGNACDCAKSGGKWQSQAEHDFNGNVDACMDACVGHWQLFAGGGVVAIGGTLAGVSYVAVVVAGCEWNCRSGNCYY